MKTYQELLVEVRAGGRGAFNELAARFRPMALSMARRHIRDDALALGEKSLLLMQAEARGKEVVKNSRPCP